MAAASVLITQLLNALMRPPPESIWATVVLAATPIVTATGIEIGITVTETETTVVAVIATGIGIVITMVVIGIGGTVEAPLHRKEEVTLQSTVAAGAIRGALLLEGAALPLVPLMVLDATMMHPLRPLPPPRRTVVGNPIAAVL